MALWPQLMATSLLAMSAGDALRALMPMLMSTSSSIEERLEQIEDVDCMQVADVHCEGCKVEGHR